MFSQNDKLQHIKGNVLLIRFAVCRTRMRLILSSSTSHVKLEKWKREKGKRAQMATVLHSSSNRRNGFWSTFQKKPVDFRKNYFNNITHTHTYIESASTQKKDKNELCCHLKLLTDLFSFKHLYRHVQTPEWSWDFTVTSHIIHTEGRRHVLTCNNGPWCPAFDETRAWNFIRTCSLENRDVMSGSSLGPSSAVWHGRSSSPESQNLKERHIEETGNQLLVVQVGQMW